MANKNFYLTTTDCTFGPTGTDFHKQLSITQPSSSSVAISLAKSTTEWDYACSISTQPEVTDWDGTWTVYVDVTTAGGYSGLTGQCYLYRYNSGGTLQETKTATSSAFSLDTTGVKTVTFGTLDWSTAASTDRIVLGFEFINTNVSKTIAAAIGVSGTYIATPIANIQYRTATIASSAASALAPTGSGSGTASCSAAIASCTSTALSATVPLIATALIATVAATALAAGGQRGNTRTIVCGLESGDTTELRATSGSVSIVTSPVHTGTYAARTNPTGSGTGYFDVQAIDTYGRPTTLDSPSDVWVKCHFRVATAPATNHEPILRFYNSGFSVTKGTLNLNSARKLEARNTSDALIATGTTVLDLDTWYAIEMRCPTGSNASYEVKLDGTSELSGTGDFSIVGTQYIFFGKSINRNNNDVDFFFDDIVVDKTGFPGSSCIVKQIIPDGNGYYTGWTASSGEKYECVDETPKNDGTDYITTTATEAYTSTLGSCSGAGIAGTIKSVLACHWSNTFSYSRQGTVRLRSSSTNADTAVVTLNTGSDYYLYGLLCQDDPATKTSWIIDGVDAAQVGVVTTGGSGTAYCTKIALMVEYDPPAAQQATAQIASVAASALVATATGSGTASATAGLAESVASGLAATGSGSGTAGATAGLASSTASSLAAAGAGSGTAPATAAIASVSSAALAATAANQSVSTAFIVPARRLWKPPVSQAEIDWSHPLARGLQLLIPLTEGGGEPKDLVTGATYTRNSSGSYPFWSAGATGIAMDFPGGARNRIDNLSTASHISGNVGTYFCRVGNIDAFPTTGIDLMIFHQSTNVYFCVRTSTNSANCFAQPINTVGTSDFLNSGPWTFVFSSDGTGSGKKLFANGVSRGSPDATPPSSIETGLKDVTIGGWSGGGGWELDGLLEIAGFTTAVWTAREALAFTADPFAFLRPIRQRIMLVVSGAAAQPQNATAAIASSTASGLGGSASGSGTAGATAGISTSASSAFAATAAASGAAPASAAIATCTTSATSATAALQAGIARAFLIPKRTLWKPTPQEAAIDWSHPLARDLRACWLFNDSAKCVDLAYRNALVISGTPAQLVAGKYGSAYRPPSTSGNYVSMTQSALLDIDTSQTVLIWTRTTSTVNGKYLIHKRQSPKAQIAIYWNTTKFASWIAGETGETWSYAPAGKGNDGLWHQLVSVRNTIADTLQCFLDCEGGEAVTDITTGSIVSNTYRCIGCAANDPVSYFYDGDIDHILIWARALSLPEIIQLRADPFAFLRPRTHRTWLITTGGPTTQHATAGIASCATTAFSGSGSGSGTAAAAATISTAAGAALAATAAPAGAAPATAGIAPSAVSALAATAAGAGAASATASLATASSSSLSATAELQGAISAAFLVPARRLWKPSPQEAAVDWSNPLAQDLQACFLFNEGSGKINDLCRRVVVTRNGAGAAVWRGCRYGPAEQFNPSASSWYSFSNYPAFTSTDQYTVVFCVARDTALTGTNPGVYRSGWTGGFGWWLNASSSKLWGRHNGNNVVSDSTGPALVAEVPRICAAWWNGSYAGLSIDGAEFNKISATTSAAWNFDYLAAQNGEVWDGYIAWTYVYKRCLSAEQILQLYVDPFCFLRPATRRIMLVVAGGAATQQATATIAVSASSALAGSGSGSGTATISAAIATTSGSALPATATPGTAPAAATLAESIASSLSATASASGAAPATATLATAAGTALPATAAATGTAPATATLATTSSAALNATAAGTGTVGASAAIASSTASALAATGAPSGAAPASATIASAAASALQATATGSGTAGASGSIATVTTSALQAIGTPAGTTLAIATIATAASSALAPAATGSGTAAATASLATSTATSFAATATGSGAAPLAGTIATASTTSLAPSAAGTGTAGAAAALASVASSALDALAIVGTQLAYPAIATAEASSLAATASATGTAPASASIASAISSSLAATATGSGTASASASIATAAGTALDASAAPGAAQAAATIATVAASSLPASAAGTGTGTASATIASSSTTSLPAAATGSGTVGASASLATAAGSALAATATPLSASATATIATVATASLQPTATGTGTASHVAGIATCASSAPRPTAQGQGTASAVCSLATASVQALPSAAYRVTLYHLCDFELVTSHVVDFEHISPTEDFTIQRSRTFNFEL